MQTGSLGDVVFEVSSSTIRTPSQVGVSRDVSFEDHQVQGDYARSEFLAPGLATVNLAITLRADLGVDPYGEAKRLEADMLEGKTLRLVILGENLGKFTIRKIDQSWRNAMKARPGPLAIDLALELKEYF